MEYRPRMQDFCVRTNSRIFFRQRHSLHTDIEHNQYDSLISSYPSMESVYRLWDHLTGYEVSFLVNALLLEGDLAGYDVRCIGHRMGVPF